ncbi:cyclase family protein [Candidatus Leptofilum sp.]|uniref:cyclase family protein n=1 Tax=Candidatus Leptofilum sp. TaxID=3241576 RepID=UPI003B5A123F
MSGKLIDVSHIVKQGVVTYKGLPAPIICDFISREASREHYAEGTEFHIGKIEMVANTGTYVDAPFHRYADGKDLSELPLSSLANLDCVVIRVPEGYGRSLHPDLLPGTNLQGKAVLFHTGWSQHWNSEQYFEGHSFLTAETAVTLQKAGVAMVGIDSYNIDDTDDGTRPVHSTLLHHDIPIAEHLTNLYALPDDNFRFFAVPVKVKAFGTFPVRAFGLV